MMDQVMVLMLSLFEAKEEFTSFWIGLVIAHWYVRPVLAQLLSNRVENLNHAQLLNLGVLVLGLWATMALIYLFIVFIAIIITNTKTVNYRFPLQLFLSLSVKDIQ